MQTPCVPGVFELLHSSGVEVLSSPQNEHGRLGMLVLLRGQCPASLCVHCCEVTHNTTAKPDTMRRNGTRRRWPCLSTTPTTRLRTTTRRRRSRREGVRAASAALPSVAALSRRRDSKTRALHIQISIETQAFFRCFPWVNCTQCGSGCLGARKSSAVYVFSHNRSNGAPYSQPSSIQVYAKLRRQKS